MSNMVEKRFDWNVTEYAISTWSSPPQLIESVDSRKAGTMIHHQYFIEFELKCHVDPYCEGAQLR